MTMGRPVLGPALVDGLDVPEVARERLRAVLETLNGSITVAEAAARLGICESRFHAIRHEALESAGARLAPRPAGRPSQRPSGDQARIAQLEARVLELERELEISQLKAELQAELSLAARAVPAAEAASLEKKRRDAKRRDRKQRKRRRKQKHR